MDTFQEVKKIGGRFEQISEQAFKDSLGGMPEKAKVELYENMAFMTDFGYFGKDSLEESHKVCFCFVISICFCKVTQGRMLTGYFLNVDIGRRTYDVEGVRSQRQALGEYMICR